MKSLYISLFLILNFLPTTFARQWERIEIPGAYCGNGEVYSVYLDKKDFDKLFIEFMAGGVCWNELSCYGDSALTRLEPLRSEPPYDLFAEESEANPWAHHSKLFFQYCTGDVFSNSHVAHYSAGVSLYHYGYRNIILALNHLNQTGRVNFSDIQDLLVWGASAGAIGAFVHTQNIEMLLPPTAHKTLISDSPGLHFGKSFWSKFSPQMNLDFKEYFGRAGLHYSPHDGFLAPYMGSVFTLNNTWNIAMLQSTRDLVMSLVFGGISPANHRKLVLGPLGIRQVAKNYSNVSTWIVDGPLHTFLRSRYTGEVRDLEGESAWNFAVRVYTEKKDKELYRSKKKPLRFTQWLHFL